MRFKTESGAADFNGFLDRGSLLEGELRFETSFRVEGKIVGKVLSEGNLIVGEGGEVEGELKVGELFVAGVVNGTVLAQRKVQLAPTGRVRADLVTPALVIENGALFDGRCEMAPAVPKEAQEAPAKKRQ